MKSIGALLRLYPEVTFLLALSGIFMGLAILAAWAERRRLRRRRLDAVGFMPWAAIFLVALFLAGICGWIALRDWVGG